METDNFEIGKEKVFIIAELSANHNGKKDVAIEKINVTDNVTDSVTDKRFKIILSLINENNQIATSEIAENLKVTKRTILRDIDKLKLQNKLKRIGGERTGHWQIIYRNHKI